MTPYSIFFILNYKLLYTLIQMEHLTDVQLFLLNHLLATTTVKSSYNKNQTATTIVPFIFLRHIVRPGIIKKRWQLHEYFDHLVQIYIRRKL